MAQPITCPVCGQNEPVEKVSTIYLMGIEARNRRGSAKADDRGGARLFTKPGASEAALAALSRRLAPPASGKQAPTRPIHPDMAVITFSVVIPIFLYGILTSQAKMLLPIALLLLGFYGIYFWQRGNLIAKFAAEKAKQQAVERRLKDSIERWMNLYYCAEDEGVFEPGCDSLVPLDQMMGYLLQDK